MKTVLHLVLVTTAAASIVPAAFSHAPYESVKLVPLHGSGVGGRIVYHAAGTGTSVSSMLRGVPANATVRVLLHAGTCRRHGASFALVVAGRLLFHGSPVPISTVADGKHVFSVVVNGRESACAEVPGSD